MISSSLMRVREYDCLVEQKGSTEKNSSVKPCEYLSELKDCLSSLRFERDVRNNNGYALMTGGKQLEGREDEEIPFYSWRLRNGREELQLKNYVGLIQIPVEKQGTTQGFFQLEILPKVDLDQSDDLDDETVIIRTKEIFTEMLRSLEYFPQRVFGEAQMELADRDILDVFIGMYLQEVRDLSRKGLKSQYLPKDANTKYLKGRLMISEQIKNNLTHKERFYVSYREYSLNRPENRLIKTTLNKLFRIAKDPLNKRLITQLMPVFDPVEVSNDINVDYSRVQKDRTTNHYEIVLEWSKIFLENMSFGFFAGERKAISLLFRMHDLFESYVFQEFRKMIESTHMEWQVIQQGKGEGKYLFEHPTNSFYLKPDIMVKNTFTEKVVILDTKWKELKETRDEIKTKYHGISNADMYQMFVYSQKFNTDKIFLLYPITQEMRQYEKENGIIEYRSRIEREGGVKKEVSVEVFFVDLSNMNASMGALTKKVEEAFRSIKMNRTEETLSVSSVHPSLNDG